MSTGTKTPPATPTPQRDKVEKSPPSRKHTNDQPIRVFDPFKAPIGPDKRPKVPGKK